MRVIESYLCEMALVIKGLPRETIARVVDVLYQAWTQNRQIFLLGNGGSAATASHFATDLGKGTILESQRRLKAIALTDNVPLLTAWANDFAFERVFVEQLANLLEVRDVVIGISASGRSPNVVRAMEYASASGAVTVGCTGRDGGRLKDIVDHCICVPSDCVGQIEDAHLILDHMITAALRERMEG